MIESTFNQLLNTLNDRLKPAEFFSLSVAGEHSQFTRFNHGKVRQTGTVEDAIYRLTLISNHRSCWYEFRTDQAMDLINNSHSTIIENLRSQLSQLPIDPYIIIPTNKSESYRHHQGNLLTTKDIIPAILERVEDLDFTGLYAGGLVIRGYGDSLGQKHWFSTNSYTLDYAIFTEDGKAVKNTIAGNSWLGKNYYQQIKESRQQLTQLNQPQRVIPPGKYRTYLAPAAAAELVNMLSWGGISEAEIRRGNSSLIPLRTGSKSLSPLFNLTENFQAGLVPQFNELGEVSPDQVPLISGGKIINTLINSRTAKEYQITANGANHSETLRSPQVASGNLLQEDILTKLDRGIYVSNLHYLNWSDRPSGRITGMTRYACFWVENGQIVAPIADLRFDESLYNFWGQNLLEITNFSEYIPQVNTYNNRQLGGTKTPGLLIDNFTYTL